MKLDYQDLDNSKPMCFMQKKFCVELKDRRKNQPSTFKSNMIETQFYFED